jgi:hypothetical protein
MPIGSLAVGRTTDLRPPQALTLMATWIPLRAERVRSNIGEGRRKEGEHTSQDRRLLRPLRSQSEQNPSTSTSFDTPYSFQRLTTKRPLPDPRLFTVTCATSAATAHGPGLPLWSC